MPSQHIRDRLESGAHLLLDGATGSELQRRGVDVLKGATAEDGLQAWSATANLDAADVVQQVHQDYLRVGADIITSNNFWTSPTRLAPAGLDARWEDYARAAGEVALRARDALNPDAYVAGGVAPPCLQSRAEGREPDVVVMGEAAFHREFSSHVKLLAEMGVDVLLLEYVGYIADCVAAVDACAETGLPVFLGVRHIQEDGAMQYDERLEDLVTALEGHGVDAILLMCSPPENMSAGLRILKAVFKGAVGAYPNIGYRPVAPLGAGGEAEDEGADFLQTGSYPPARLAGFAREWKDLGARIFGGCCATGPEHVQAMRRVVKG